MKKNRYHLIHTSWIVGAFILIGFVIPGYFINPITIGADARNVFTDPNGNITFKYPSSFSTNQSSTFSENSVIDVFPSSRKSDQIKPIEIFYEIDPNPQIDILTQTTASNILVTKATTLKLKVNNIQGFQYTYVGSSGEKTVVSSFKANSLIYTFVFNQKYFSIDNPLVLVDNTSLASEYANILNSTSFN
jgi:hypothetical protein